MHEETGESITIIRFLSSYTRAPHSLSKSKHYPQVSMYYGLTKIRVFKTYLNVTDDY